MKKQKTVIPAIGLLAVIAVSQGPAWARTFEVTSTEDAWDLLPGDGVCESTLPGGACTLRAALQEANASSDRDIVSLPSGVFRLDIGGRDEDESATGDLDVLESVHVRGEGSALTIIDANGIDRALDVPRSGTHLKLFDLTVRGGDAVGDGGGIRASHDTRVSLGRVTLEDNVATGHGGGLAGDALCIFRSLIRFNQSGASGGGLEVTGDLYLWWSAIRENTSVTGPAISSGCGACASSSRRVVIGRTHVVEDDVAQ